MDRVMTIFSPKKRPSGIYPAYFDWNANINSIKQKAGVLGEKVGDPFFCHNCSCLASADRVRRGRGQTGEGKKRN